MDYIYTAVICFVVGVVCGGVAAIIYYKKILAQIGRTSAQAQTAVDSVKKI
jgi:hypothetical protein